MQSTKQDRDSKSGKDQSNKRPTSAAQADRAEVDEFVASSNIRERRGDPSPDDRDRGEISSKEPAEPLDADRG